MQHCPNCGNPLPDKASFCARCGQRFTNTNDPALQKQSKSPLSTAGKNSEAQAPLALSAEGKTTMPANGPTPEGKPASPPAPKTPLPIAGGMIAATETVEVQAPSRTPLPTEPAPDGPQGIAHQAPPKTSLPPAAAPTEARGTSGEQGPQRVPPPVRVSTPPRTPSPARIPPASSHRAEIADQKTRAVPAAPKTSLPRPGSNSGNNRSMVEAQPTVPVTAMRPTRNGPPGPPPGTAMRPTRNGPPVTAMRPTRNGPPGPPPGAAMGPTRNGPPGPPPAAGMYNNSAFVPPYRGNRPSGNTAARTRALPPPSKPAPIPVRTIGGLIWSLISPIFERALDSEPEKPKRPLSQFTLLGWLPVISLTSALGLFTTVVAFNASRDNTPGAELYYWLGVGLIYIPIVVRLILPHASRAERVGLLCVATLCLFLTKVSLSPLYYSGYDEFLHWRTINDILSSGHLFTKNALLPVSPFYPGLEIVASALSNISGLSSIQAGFTVVGVACLIMVLSLFLVAELLSGSARLASIAAVIYMANPHFLFFDTQFAYESLALPLATFVMFAMVRYETLNNNRIWVLLAAWTALLAMDLTHHATNFVFEGLFLLWAIVYLFLRPLPLRKSIVIITMFVGIALTVTTVLVIGDIVIGYFTSFFRDVSSQVAQTLGSSSGSQHQLFGGAGVTPTPLWERLISLGSVGLITLSIPFLLLCFWRRYRRNSLVWVFAIIMTFYPVLQVLRLTTSGAEISDRTSAFIFIAFAFLAAVAIVQFWPVRFLNWKHSAVISAALLVLFMGGIILGEGIPPTFMPGRYAASADSRSIDAEGIQVALWANIYLGPNQRMYTDRVNQLLMSIYGDQYLVTKIGDNIDVTDVIFDTTVGNYEASLLQKGRVHYLALDMRLTTQFPQDGFYYEQGEPLSMINGQEVPLQSVCLTKFDGVPQVNRLFDSGNMVIYDTGGLINAPQIP